METKRREKKLMKKSTKRGEEVRKAASTTLIRGQRIFKRHLEKKERKDRASEGDRNRDFLPKAY